MTALPWALVPTILVPFFLIAHSIVFVQLHVRMTDEATARSIAEIAEAAERMEVGQPFDGVAGDKAHSNVRKV